VAHARSVHLRIRRPVLETVKTVRETQNASYTGLKPGENERLTGKNERLIGENERLTLGMMMGPLTLGTRRALMYNLSPSGSGPVL